MPVSVLQWDKPSVGLGVVVIFLKLARALRGTTYLPGASKGMDQKRQRHLEDVSLPASSSLEDYTKRT